MSKEALKWHSFFVSALHTFWVSFQMEVSSFVPTAISVSLAADLNIKQLFCSLCTIGSSTVSPPVTLLTKLLMGMSQHGSQFFPNQLNYSIGFAGKGCVWWGSKRLVVN